MKLWLISVLGILVLATPVVAAPADDTPSWVQQAAAVKVPSFDKESRRRFRQLFINKD